MWMEVFYLFVYFFRPGHFSSLGSDCMILSCFVLVWGGCFFWVFSRISTHNLVSNYQKMLVSQSINLLLFFLNCLKFALPFFFASVYLSLLSVFLTQNCQPTKRFFLSLVQEWSLAIWLKKIWLHYVILFEQNLV